MSVLIKGMEMPDYGYVCLKVFANGEVLMTKVHRGALVITGIKDKVGTAIPVLPHGRLIDADALIDNKEWVRDAWGQDEGITEAVNVANIINAPTIIPAEEAKDTNAPTYDLLYEEGGAGTT